MKKLQDLPLDGKKVLVRVDFNVPLSDQGEIADDTRIRASLPTIRYILEHGGRPILMSHLGRPKGEKKRALSLSPCAKRLEELLKTPVKMAPDCVGDKVMEMASDLKKGEVLLLENLRFHKAEEKPELDEGFALSLSRLGDLYVNDAFGTAHRAHSSTYNLAKLFKGHSAPGFLLEKEIDFLGSHFDSPRHPFYAVIGGAKVSSKLGVLTSLLEKVDALFIGGGMAYTFMKAQGISIGNSLCEDELLDVAKTFLQEAKAKNIPLFLPEDLIIADSFQNDANTQTIEAAKGIPEGWEGMDIGPVTRNQWANTLKNAQMVFWNGPLGVFEMDRFAAGTDAIASALASTTATTIVGGGDSVAAINKAHLAEKFSHISTGGGASLEYIEHGHLPGIDALN